MKHLTDTYNLNLQLEEQKENIRSERDEVVSKFTEAINAERVGTKYKPITKRAVALLINRHPILGKDISECWYLYKKCKENHFGYFFHFTKIK